MFTLMTVVMRHIGRLQQNNQDMQDQDDDDDLLSSNLAKFQAQIHLISGT